MGSLRSFLSFILISIIGISGALYLTSSLASRSHAQGPNANQAPPPTIPPPGLPNSPPPTAAAPLPPPAAPLVAPPVTPEVVVPANPAPVQATAETFEG